MSDESRRARGLAEGVRAHQGHGFQVVEPELRGEEVHDLRVVQVARGKRVLHRRQGRRVAVLATVHEVEHRLKD